MRILSLISMSLIGAAAALATPITSLSTAVHSAVVRPIAMTPTPEPATIGMFAAGISLLALKAWRRK